MGKIWSEIRSDYEDEGIIHIDAWLTDDDNEDGRIIAKVNSFNGSVEYIDARAKTDEHAQEVINETLRDIFAE